MAQQSLSKLANDIYFNVWKGNPDSVIIKFLEENVPILAVNRDEGKWSAFPPQQFPVQEACEHSFKFDKHPSLPTEFKDGKLIVFTKEVNGKVISIRDIFIVFDFDTKDQAQLAFDSLVFEFDKLSSEKKIYNTKGNTIADFTDLNSSDWDNNVKFVLQKGASKDTAYQITFRIGIKTQY